MSRRFREGERLREVLHDVDLEVDAGETAVLLGPSGSGKSTLLNLISGIDSPDAGLVRVAGVELTHLSERERTLFRRDQIGFVFQFFNLIPTLTVEENVFFTIELQGDPDGTRRAAALDLLEAVGLAGRGRSYPDVLSGGEQQRVAIVRALAHEPALVLADEPTGNLDEASGRRVMALLRDLVEKRGGTLLVVTHAEAIVSGSDRVFRLRDGRVVEADPIRHGT